MNRYWLAWLLLLWGCNAMAQGDHEVARHLRETGKIVPLQRLIDHSRGIQPGRLLEVELESKSGKLVYELEILDENGRVWELFYNASTGELIERKEDL